jgi:RNA polymerase sigma-70 factor (ECF subfamily)
MPLIYQLVRKSGLQPTDAADVTQNVLLELTKSLGEFNRQNRGSFRKWLKVVTTNKVNDFFRKQQSVGNSDKLHAALNNKNGVSLPPPTEDEHAANNSPPLNERQIMVQMVLNQVKEQVSEKTWQAFQLMSSEALTSEEIGRQLGMTAEAARMAKVRVLKKIQDRYEGTQQQSQ